MKSLLLAGNGAVRIIEVPTPEPKSGEVLIRTVYSAVCGSELHAWRGAGQEHGNSGHEAAGVVVRCGADVKDLTPGMRVGAAAVIGCGRCDQCARGRYTWCDKFTGAGSMHAEYFTLPARGCQRLPDDAPWDAAVLLSGDGFGVPYHSSRKFADQPVSTVAVFGLGPIGLGSVMLQAYLGRRVIGVDVVPYRLEYARRLGAAEVVEARTDAPVPRIRALTGGRGVDVAIEAAGRPETAKQCFQAVARGGLVVFNGEQPAVELSPSDDFIRRDVRAAGSWYYFFSEFGDMLALYRQGLDVTRLISHRFPAAEAERAFSLFAAGAAAKVLLDWRSA